ncbi:MAG: PASTA domain-containing protein [Bacteroidia bacterium]
MSIKNFLKSPVFFKQVGIALVIIMVVIFLLLHWLDFFTNHGEEIPVPDLRKTTVENAQEKLDELDLEAVVLDTVDFDPGFPPYTITEQDPLPKVGVKHNRKIYVKVNAGGYGTVKLPDLIQKSYRQAVPMLKTAGLEEGQKIYMPYMAKDVVLEMQVNGKAIKAGSKVLKASKIDLIVGDGKESFTDTDSTEVDTTGTE